MKNNIYIACDTVAYKFVPSDISEIFPHLPSGEVDVCRVPGVPSRSLDANAHLVTNAILMRWSYMRLPPLAVLSVRSVKLTCTSEKRNPADMTRPLKRRRRQHGTHQGSLCDITEHARLATAYPKD